MYRRFLFALCLVAGAAAAMPACSNQQEGERCDHRGDNAGNDDCDQGLYCTQNLPNAPFVGSTKSDVCCPLDLSKATTTACSLFGGVVDSGIPDDANGTPVPDTGADSATDGAVLADANVSDSSPDSAVVDAGPDTAAPADAGGDTSADAVAE